MAKNQYYGLKQLNEFYGITTSQTFVDEFATESDSLIDSIMEMNEIAPGYISDLCDQIKEASKGLDAEFSSIITEAAGNGLGGLKKFGITVNPSANSDIQRASNKIVAEVKKNGITKETKQTISKTYYELIQKISDSISYSVDPTGKFANYESTKILKSFALLSYVLITNTLIQRILVVLFGRLIGGYLTAIFVAPVVEEGAKAVATRGGFDKEFFVVFNACEFTQYVTRYSNIKNIVPIRIVAAGMHLTTTIIHNLAENPKVLKALGASDDQEKKEKVSFIAHVVSMLIHHIWNNGGGYLIIYKVLKL